MKARQTTVKVASALAWLAGLWLAAIGGSVPALAGPPVECRVDGVPSEAAFPLNYVKKAIGNKKLSILVLGTGSSQLGGAAQNAYPARLQAALSRRLPDVAVAVAVDVAQKRTAADMVRTLSPALAASKPDLVLWQTATVDAIQAVDPDQFSQALDKGVRLVRAAKADVIFINPQYSPRTELVIALGTYVENMRWVAVQKEVPVFDRFNLMKAWYDQGTFDLYSATKKLDMARLVHDCLGRLLADLIVEAAKPDPAVIEKGN
ncbi:SGNH/GDSL hydrolase family protein [Undibacter mobilis]|uniref:SGNH/GDSL hydrolase family protein n=1 Tax=Undibacter mobilis TaxID=2292256 RepID=A0A371B7Q5_9BRAD|nr:SGNH/GDSL hydrolase family protein [Undibacter mobilis]RDV03552.1 SGNH/GDSL hydrolase family protein [Undibacter mobilis]